jgi:hypothetical protein
MYELSAAAVEAAARAAAIHEDYDGCFERLDAWEAASVEERELGLVEEPMSTDVEDADLWRARMRSALPAAYPHMVAGVVEPLPEIRFKGPDDTDASMFRRMAWNLRNGYPAGGSNACDALARLIDREVDRAGLDSLPGGERA